LVLLAVTVTVTVAVVVVVVVVVYLSVGRERDWAVGTNGTPKRKEIVLAKNIDPHPYLTWNSK
jgi:hypothetical protein